jgi:3D (Asp-Asp-Asp) domain-containing protein
LLSQEGIELQGKDYAIPVPASPVVDYISVSITRVREDYYTETEQLSFESRWEPNPELELDQRVVAQTGAKGNKNRLFKSIYENGKLISTGLEREWIDKPPQDHIIQYGTKIALRDLTLPDGNTVQYWRKLRLLATAYTAATSGKTKDHPEYGKTRLGLSAGRGIVAVDPRVINLSSPVYVPGYGIAVAGDTGGRIKGRRIDLGFPEDAIEDWYRWVDVYLLAPVPPASQINVNLPDYPAERSNQR